MADSQLPLLQAGQHLILPGSLNEVEAHQFIKAHASVLCNAELSEIRLVFGQDPQLALAYNGYYAALVRSPKNSAESANTMDILIQGSGRTGKELAEAKRTAIRQLAAHMEDEVVRILKEKDKVKEGRKRQRQTE